MTRPRSGVYEPGCLPSITIARDALSTGVGNVHYMNARSLLIGSFPPERELSDRLDSDIHLITIRRMQEALHDRRINHASWRPRLDEDGVEITYSVVYIDPKSTNTHLAQMVVKLDDHGRFRSVEYLYYENDLVNPDQKPPKAEGA